MKTKLIILILAGALALVMMNSCTKAQASIFGPSASEQEAKQRLISTENQLTYQRHNTENMTGAAVALGFGCILLLFVGTAMGSKIRRSHTHAHGI